MTKPHLVFLAGVPASGKSHFGAWLASEHGYLHVDAERPGALERAGLREAWNHAVAARDCTAFADHLRRGGRPTVFNWGFPLHCLPVAAALKRAGFACWWLDADLVAARRAHADAGRPVEAFDAQIAAMRQRLGSIARIFHPHIVTALDGTGHRLPPRALLQRLRHSA